MSTNTHSETHRDAEPRFWAWLGVLQLLIAVGAILAEGATHPEAVAIGAIGVAALGVGAGCCWHAGRLRGVGGEAA